MLRTPAYFDAFMGSLPQTVALRKEHRDLLERNQALAGACSASLHRPQASVERCCHLTADKNMQLREGHEALKRDTQAAFDDARSLQARWHQHVVPTQAEAYKVGGIIDAVIRCIPHSAEAYSRAPPPCTRIALRSQCPAR